MVMGKDLVAQLGEQLSSGPSVDAGDYRRHAEIFADLDDVLEQDLTPFGTSGLLDERWMQHDSGNFGKCRYHLELQGTTMATKPVYGQPAEMGPQNAKPLVRQEIVELHLQPVQTKVDATELLVTA